MDPLHNYDECVQIETARCDARAACKGTETFDASYPGFDKDTCIAYAKENCRTRKIGAAGTLWDQRDVESCVTAIGDLSCDDLIPRGIDETESLDACWFIDGIDTAAPNSDTDTETDTDTDTDADTDTNDSGEDAGD